MGPVFSREINCNLTGSLNKRKKSHYSSNSWAEGMGPTAAIAFDYGGKRIMTQGFWDNRYSEAQFAYGTAPNNFYGSRCQA
jgi:hypothetical protein